MPFRYAGAIISLECGKYLFQQRDHTIGISNPGVISSFGGSIDEGEGPKQAIARELWEELELRVDHSDLRFLGYFEKHEAGGKIVQSFYFLIGPVARPITCNEGSAVSLSYEEYFAQKDFAPVTGEMLNRAATVIKQGS